MTVFGSGDLPPARNRATRAGGQASLGGDGTGACLNRSRPESGSFIYQFRPLSSMRNPNDTTYISTGAVPTAGRWRGVRFLYSVNALAQLPPDTGREVAFAGRSNAGKSSAINLLTSQRQLARVSKTPGRTQLLNFFWWSRIATWSICRVTVMPGFPTRFAGTGGELLERYLTGRAALRGLLLLMDIRHPLTDMDRQLLDGCAARELPAHILLTKADKSAGARRWRRWPS